MTKQNFMLAIAGALLVAGCAPLPPDYGPIGSGLTAIGICLVVYGAVCMLGELVRNDPPEKKPHRRKRRARFSAATRGHRRCCNRS